MQYEYESEREPRSLCKCLKYNNKARFYGFIPGVHNVDANFVVKTLSPQRTTKEQEAEDRQ
jgi:hypothetical protein